MSDRADVEAIPLGLQQEEQQKDFDPEAAQTKPDISASDHVIPDGGRRAWMTVAGAWFISAICFGYANAYGVYQAYYVEYLLPSYSPSAISWIGSLQVFFLYAMGIVSGPLFDAGYVRLMLIVGSVLYVGCIFAQAQAKVDAYYQVFLSQAVGQGLAMGLLYLPGMAVVFQHFHKKRSVAMGIAFTGSSIGGIVFPIMINNIFANNGYVWGVRAAGFFVLGCCILANLLIRPNYPPRHTRPPMPSLGKLFSDAPYAICTAGAVIVGFGLFFIYFYIQLFTLTRGLSETFSFYTLAIVNGASVFGRTLPNILADRIGISPVLVSLTFVAGALVFAVFGIKSVGGAVIVCLLYGFCTGAYVSLTGPFFAAMADSLSEMGVRMGLALAFVGVAALVGTPIDGALIGSGPDYTWWRAITFSAIMMMGGSVITAFGAYLLGKKRGKRWV